MIVRFNYQKNVHNKRPLLFVIEIRNGKVNGFNLNYLHEYKVQELFNWANRMFEGRIKEAFRQEAFFNLQGNFTRIGFTNKLAPSDVDVKEFYDRTLKARYLNQAATKNCYRTYNLDKVSALKIVNYDIDIWTQYVKTGKYKIL